MNNTESVNIPVKLLDSLVACAIRLEYARKNDELEVSPDVTEIVEQALEYSNSFNRAQRPEDFVSQEIQGKPLAEYPKAFLGDSEDDSDKELTPKEKIYEKLLGCAISLYEENGEDPQMEETLKEGFNHSVYFGALRDFWDQERRKEWYAELAEEYPPYAKGHGGRPGAIPIGDGKVLTSDGEILAG